MPYPNYPFPDLTYFLLFALCNPALCKEFMDSFCDLYFFLEVNQVIKIDHNDQESSITFDLPRLQHDQFPHHFLKPSTEKDA